MVDDRWELADLVSEFKTKSAISQRTSANLHQPASAIFNLYNLRCHQSKPISMNVHDFDIAILL